MIASRRHFDITRTLHQDLVTWPGDIAFDYRLTWRMADGASVNVGAVTMGTHFGTHVDAPLHFQADGAGIDTLDPAIFMGPALVVDVGAAGASITRVDLAAAGDFPGGGVTRLLLKTGAWTDGTTFPPVIPTLAVGVAAWLGSLGIKLLGVDVPSVDAEDSHELPVHHALREAGILILESLDLTAVPAGLYELMALPLKIAGADAAPVRAILRELPVEL